MSRGILSVVFATLLVLAPAIGSSRTEPESDPLRAKADLLHAYEEGSWECRWEILDDDGEVVSEMVGREIFTPSLDGLALDVVTRVDGRDTWNQGVKFFSPQEKKIVFLDWGTDGDYWIMKQDVETGVVESEPKTLPDGRSLVLRFTVVRKTDNEQDVVMDMSTDGGSTWSRRTRQFMRRIDS